MKFIDVTSETPFLEKQWKLAKVSEKSGDLQAAHRHYYKARVEALWLLDYAIARGEQQAALMIHEILEDLGSEMDDIKRAPGDLPMRPGSSQSSRETNRTPALYLLLRFLQRLVPNGQKQTLTRVKV